MPTQSFSIRSRSLILDRRVRVVLGLYVLSLTVFMESIADGQDKSDVDRLAQAWSSDIRPVLQTFCHECHAGDRIEAEIDLSSFATTDEIRKQVGVWLKVRHMLDSQQMPPKDSKQPTDAQRNSMRKWVREFLTLEAAARAGDPGPVVLRRLNNDEYNYTIRDLTGVDSLDPTREFPVDGAAGEGFTNAGSAQAMSPSLVQKYLDAGKQVAQHLVLKPGGIGFSTHTTRRDKTDEIAARIQKFYRRFTADSDGKTVELHGLKFDTDQGGDLPLEPYIRATIEERSAFSARKKSVEDVAAERGLTAKYLGHLWNTLAAQIAEPPPGTERSNTATKLIDQLREQWRTAQPADVPALVASITQKRDALWKFNPVGHIGKNGKSPDWMVPVTPVAPSRNFTINLPDKADAVSVFLTASDAADGTANDYVVWENPRLVMDNGHDIPLRDLAGLQERMSLVQREALTKTTRYLAAASEIQVAESSGTEVNAGLIQTTAMKHGLDVAAFNVWLDYLAINEGAPVTVSGHFAKTETHGTYKFITSWGTGATPIIGANSSDTQVRVPGIAKPHGVTAHPSPTLFAAIGWHSPINGLVQIDASIADAHPECGDGQEWFLQHRTGSKVGNLWKGAFNVGGKAKMPTTRISVRKGELISFILGPKGNYVCDLTEMNLTISEVAGEKRVWDMAKDVSGDILAANPHADSHGNTKTWHFYKGELKSIDREGGSLVNVPAGSLLAKWQAESDPAKRESLANQIQALAIGDQQAANESPDAVLYEQLNNLTFSSFGIDGLLDGVDSDDRFGRHPLGHKMNSTDLIVKAPSVIEFKVPARLAAGRRLVVTGRLDEKHGRDGTVKLEAGLARIEPSSISPPSPIVTIDDSQARHGVEASFAAFRNLFPPKLCYARIVPVDEVVTLTLWFREDDHLQRLMLSDAEVNELNALWDELFFVAQEPLRYEVAFEQIREFATQDRPDLVKVWDPLKPSVVARANAFRKRLVKTEPVHLEALIEFTGKAWRRPLTSTEQVNLRGLYRNLRDAEIPHDPAIRLTLSRVLTSPAFLYRREAQPAEEKASPVAASELASRLSYFLWSSTPDPNLREAAETGRLTRNRRRPPDATSNTPNQENEELLRQTRRMLRDARTRRLAIQFACQWLHLRDFDQNDDKNEKLYPEFADLRGAMYEETVRFFEDMFRNDGSILDLLNADHTFINDALAKHYGINLPESGNPKRERGTSSSPSLTRRVTIGDAEWHRVDGVRTKGRGGILGMATLLASQSGASRTSPILRGNWISETLLGEKLPKPPADVPQLPEAVPEGLTARQLIERHSSVPECAKCHARIDPYGFALEQYDAIGRLRPKTVNTKTKLVDGQEVDGISGLRDYLANERRDDIVRQFCRKLLGFALGREVQLSDEPLLDTMLERLRDNDYRFSVAVETVVLSPQFRKIRGRTLTADK